MICNLISIFSVLGILSPYCPDADILLLSADTKGLNEIGYHFFNDLPESSWAFQEDHDLNVTNISGRQSSIVVVLVKNLNEKVLESISKQSKGRIVLLVVENTNLVKNVSKGDFGINTKIFLWSMFEEQLFQFYSVTTSSDVLVKEMALSEIRSLTYQRKDFAGAQLIGSHVNIWNLNTKSGNETLEYVKLRLKNQFWLFGDGMEYEWWSYTQDFLNFTLKTVSASGYGKVHFSPGNNTLGTRNNTRRWTGIPEQIEQKIADFAISNTIQLPPFARGFRFLTPHNSVINTYLHFISSSHAFVQPYETIFKLETWICVAGTLFFIMLFRIFIIKEGVNAKLESFVWVFAIITQKNWEDKNDNPSSQKILTLTGSFLCLILYTTFCSQLISSLSIESDNFVTVENLIHQGFTFGIDEYLVIGDRNGDLLSSTINSGTNDPLFGHLDKTHGYPTYQAGVEALFSKSKYGWLSPFRIVFPISTSMKSKWTNELLCSELNNIELPEYKLKASSIVRKDSPYSEYFNYARMVMKERGIESLLLQRREHMVEFHSLDCKEDDKLWFFGLGDLKLPFGVITFGILISFVLFVLEVCLFRKKSIQYKFRSQLYYLKWKMSNGNVVM